MIIKYILHSLFYLRNIFLWMQCHSFFFSDFICICIYMYIYIYICIQMRGGYYRIVGKYGMPRFHLWLELLFRRNTMKYSRTPRCNAVRSEGLLMSYHFLQIKICFVIYKSFSCKFSLKLITTYVIWILMLIIVYIQIIVVCYTSVVF